MLSAACLKPNKHVQPPPANSGSSAGQAPSVDLHSLLHPGDSSWWQRGHACDERLDRLPGDRLDLELGGRRLLPELRIAQCILEGLRERLRAFRGNARRDHDGTIGDTGSLAYTAQTQPAMDNTSVDLDRERANFVDNAVRYEATLRFINGHSKTILSAIQGQ